MQVALQAAQARGLVTVPLSALVWQSLEGGVAGKSKYLLQYLVQATAPGQTGKRQDDALDQALVSSLVMGWRPVDETSRFLAMSDTPGVVSQSAASVASLGVVSETAVASKLAASALLASSNGAPAKPTADVLDLPTHINAPNAAHLSKLLNDLQLAGGQGEQATHDTLRAVQQMLLEAAPPMGPIIPDQSTTSSSQGMLFASPFSELPGPPDSNGGGLSEADRLGSGSTALDPYGGYPGSRYGAPSDAGSADVLMRALHSSAHGAFGAAAVLVLYWCCAGNDGKQSAMLCMWVSAVMRCHLHNRVRRRHGLGRIDAHWCLDAPDAHAAARARPGWRRCQHAGGGGDGGGRGPRQDRLGHGAGRVVAVMVESGFGRKFVYFFVRILAQVKRAVLESNDTMVWTQLMALPGSGMRAVDFLSLLRELVDMQQVVRYEMASWDDLTATVMMCLLAVSVLFTVCFLNPLPSARQLFDWSLSLPQDHPLRDLTTIDQYSSLLMLCVQWQAFDHAITVLNNMLAQNLQCRSVLNMVKHRVPSLCFLCRLCLVIYTHHARHCTQRACVCRHDASRHPHQPHRPVLLALQEDAPRSSV